MNPVHDHSVTNGQHPNKLAAIQADIDEAERTAIRAMAQARAITLGPRILRGETAAIAAIALWMGTTGDW